MNMSQETRQAVQGDFLLFCKAMFELEGKTWLDNWHQKAICDALEKLVIGDITRLVINIPPRYSKTEIAVVNFIAWTMGLFPDSEFIHASYSKRLATNNAYKTRALMMSEAYQAVFPDVKLKDDSKAKDEFRTTKDGVVYATGSEGTITGYGAGKVRHGFAGAVIIDDAHKASEALSDIKRQNVIDWYQSTMESRLNKPETPIIVIMQRLHEEDLAGWLLAGGTGETWEHLCIPVLNEDDEPLWEAKHDRKTLLRMEQADPYTFAGQYMQTPTPKEGGMVKIKWFRRYDSYPHDARIIQSWDTAQKSNQLNDPSVCTTWAKTDLGHYLIDVQVMRVRYPELKRAVISLASKYNPDTILVEDKSSGSSIIQDLQSETMLPVIPIMPCVDKATRLSTCTSLIESGHVYIPNDATWLFDFEKELSMFPRGKHDDQVDSFSQYLNWARKDVEILIC